MCINLLTEFTDLLNMTYRSEIHVFYKKVNRGNIFIFEATVLKFSDLLGGCKLVANAKFQHNISKVMLA